MKSSSTVRLLVGSLFIILGAVLLLRVTGVLEMFDLPYYLISWQMVLIVLGIFLLATEGNRVGGLILILIGGVFLAREVFDTTFREIIMFVIPVILLFAGVALLFPRFFSKKKRYGTKKSVTDKVDDIEMVSIFSDDKRIVQSDRFRGGEVVCIFAGSELHFKEATLAPDHNELEVVCIFGGCTLIVPRDWTIRSEAVNIFAGLSDKRYKTSNDKKPADPEKTLTIKGFLLFGGLDIKSV